MLPVDRSVSILLELLAGPLLDPDPLAICASMSEFELLSGVVFQKKRFVATLSEIVQVTNFDCKGQTDYLIQIRQDVQDGSPSYSSAFNSLIPTTLAACFGNEGWPGISWKECCRGVFHTTIVIPISLQSRQPVLARP